MLDDGVDVVKNLEVGETANPMSQCADLAAQVKAELPSVVILAEPLRGYAVSAFASSLWPPLFDAACFGRTLGSSAGGRRRFGTSY